jgi:predicted ATPase
MEFFHAGRALPPTRGARLSFGVPGPEAQLRLVPTNEKYRPLRAYAVAQIQADNQAVADTARERGVVVGSGQFHAQQEIRDMLRPFLREKVFDGIEPEQAGYRLRFRCNDNTVLDLDELSASEQQGVLFALTFRQQELHHSIVLIDEPERHVHPAHVEGFLSSLAALGRDNQIITATSSPGLLRRAIEGQVIDLSFSGAPAGR